MASFTGDGAYDQDGVSAAIAERHPEAAIIVPPHSTAVSSEVAETAPTQRDGHLHSIAEHGRAAWQKASGHTKRARAEAAISRFKQVIGDGLRSRTDQRRATEVEVAVNALNRMLDLGRRISVSIACPERGLGLLRPHLWSVQQRRMLRPMENSSRAGDHVYEPFSPSGTTLIAGEMSGRVVHAIEINPLYVDVAVRRWEAFTGRTAILGGEMAAISPLWPPSDAQNLASGPLSDRRALAAP